MNLHPRPVRRRTFVWALAGAASIAPSLSARWQQDPLGGLLEGARDWARENLNDDANALIRGLAEGSPGKVRAAVAALEKGFGGDAVLDVAKLRAVANAVLPVLGQFEETAPYVPWLRTRLDYFDAADAWAAARPVGGVTVTVPPAPPTRRGEPPPKPTNAVPAPVPSRGAAAANPSAEAQRSIWTRLFSKRPEIGRAHV